MNFNKVLTLVASCLLTAAISNPVVAGGIAPGATRVVYPENENQASLAISNSDGHTRYLIQAWVNDAKEQRVKDFIVTPPLFTIPPKSENTLRIVYTGEKLPADREVVYWINIKAIPAIDKESVKGQNTLQLAVLSRMKLFMRPPGLEMSELESVKHLRFRLSSGKLTIINPTPYYQSLVNISVGSKKLSNNMVPPFGELSIPVLAGTSDPIHYQTINDYGAISSQLTGVMQ